MHRKVRVVPNHRTTAINVATTMDKLNRTDAGFTYSVTKAFKNNLGYSVDVIDKSNVRTTIEPNPTINLYDGTFVIKYTIRYNKHYVKINLDDLSDGELLPEVKALKDAHESGCVRIHCTHDEYNIEYIISGSDFKNTGYASYYEDVDVTLVRSGAEHRFVHPHSKLAETEIARETRRHGSFNYSIEINDPNNEVGIKYANINGRVYAVNKTNNPAKQPGVYLHIDSAKARGGVFTDETVVEFYSFDEADEKVPLWNSASHAKQFGDTQLAKKEKIADMQLEALVAKAEIEKNKVTTEYTKQELDAIARIRDYETKTSNMYNEMHYLDMKNRLERERTEREYESMRHKFNYESRALARKETSELVKWLPPIITGIIAVGTFLLNKLKP